MKESTKKHILRNIEKCFKEDILFVTVNRKLYMYPSTLTVEQAIFILLSEREELENGVDTIENLQGRPNWIDKQ